MIKTILFFIMIFECNFCSSLSDAMNLAATSLANHQRSRLFIKTPQRDFSNMPEIPEFINLRDFYYERMTKVLKISREMWEATNMLGDIGEANNEHFQQFRYNNAKNSKTEYSKNTIQCMAYWHMEKIRSFQPKPLPDLSDTDLNIVEEVENIFSKISLNENNPLFLDISMIDDQKSYELKDIKNRALGFLKTLTNQPLKEGETEGWQMYEEDKPALINVMKHLLLNIGEKLETPDNQQSGLLAFSVILKGILHCPTGQAEGVNSAVNMILHKQDALTSDADYKVGHYIMASAVQKAFLNAFHNKGGVHAMSRARFVLKDYLNLPQGIETFHERISRVAEEEIPGLYNQFFDIFSKKFVLEEARRNIQTEEDFNLIQNYIFEKGYEKITLKKKIAIMKQERPISVSEIAQWLNDLSLDPSDFGIDDDYKMITDDGLMLVFKQMGFITT